MPTSLPHHDVSSAAAVLAAPSPTPSSTSSSSTFANDEYEYEYDAIIAYHRLLHCDDALHRILSYADLVSLVRFACMTSSELRDRMRPIAAAADDDERRIRRSSDVWRTAFEGHNFSPIERGTVSSSSSSSSVFGYGRLGGELLPRVDHRDALRTRVALWSKLRGLRKRRRRSLRGGGEGEVVGRRCFVSGGDGTTTSSSSATFRFVPLILPRDVTDVDDVDELALHPPVEFACDSYRLLSTGIGSKFVILDPFSGTIELHEDVLDTCGVVRGGSASRVGRTTTLFSIEDYFDADLEWYFGRHTPFGGECYDRDGRWRGGGAVGGNDAASTSDDGATIDWVGVDAHVALDDDGVAIARCLIGAARTITMDSSDIRRRRRMRREVGGGGDETDAVVTEILAWCDLDGDRTCVENLIPSSGAYDCKYVCRAAGSFYFMDICARHRMVYASCQVGCCPFRGGHDDLADYATSRRGGDNDDRRSLMDIDDDSMVNDDGGPIRMSRSVYRLPLMRYAQHPSSSEEIGSYFPQPNACITAQYPVSSFSVDPTGRTIVVGTTCGTVEVWHTGMDRRINRSTPLRLQIMSVRESFLSRFRAMTMDSRGGPIPSTGVCLDGKLGVAEFDDHNSRETVDDLALLDNDIWDEERFPHKHPTCKISQIYIPCHLPVQKCGFVSKQRCTKYGTTLVLWQTPTISSDMNEDITNERFRITAMINLPLSAQCHPAVHFDGRRLIVFGKDHIGLIILVYHVLGTRYDQSDFEKETGGEEESGGVVQLSGERRINFVNRIRHAGLGGLEYFDSMLMTANERFLIVNTKTGNLIGNDIASNATDGLFVIDLLRTDCRF